MPQPDHVSIYDLPDFDALDDDTKRYFEVCQEKLGMVPNVLRTFSANQEKLRAFGQYYNTLMLAPSGLSKLEREMIAVVVSSANRCFYCLVAHGQAVRALSGDPQLGEMLVMNYRVAELPERQKAMLDFAVKEYEPDTGKVVRTFATDDRGREKRDWPFTAIRLSNGNTLIGCTNGNRIIEVDGDGKIVWSVTNEDLGENLFDDACGVQRLPNGNTVVTSYHAKGDSVKLFEVTRDKKVVWRYSGMKAGFHHFQILTTNGKPVDPNTWK